jgi:hypothetical protein
VKPRTPHPFVADDDMPPDHNGRQVCRCGLIGEPGDAHHQMPDVPEMAEHRRRAGDENE